MPVHIIVGLNGSGKTTRILQTFRRFSPSEHQASVCLVVPSVSQAIRLRKLVLSDPDFPGIFGDPICTFTRLATELTPNALNPITDTQRQIILREIIQSAPQGCFDEVRRSPGFLPELAGMIRTLSGSGIASDDLSNAVSACDSLPKHATDRILSLMELYRSYESMLRHRNLAEPEGLLGHVVETLSADPAPLRTLQCVLFDGFSDFSLAEHDFIKLLAQNCEQVVITAEDDPGFPGASVEYLEGQRTPDQQAFIAADQRMEVEMIAREIRRLVREQGFQHSDIAIVTRSMRDQRRITGILKKYRIAISDEVHLLSQSPLALRVLSHLETIGSSREVQSFLRDIPLPEAESQLREHCAVWKAVLRIADGIQPEGPFRDLLKAGIESGIYRLPGEIPDGVSLLTAGSIDGRRFRAVFVLDCADGVFPRHQDDDPFISDSERQVLNAYLPHPLPTIADAEAQERRLFLRMISSACDRLYLCRISDDEPSPYLDDLPCTVCGPGDILPPIAQAETPRELVARTVLDLCTSDEPVAAETYNRLLDAGLVGADTFSRLGRDYAVFVPAHLRLLTEEPPEEA